MIPAKDTAGRAKRVVGHRKWMCWKQTDICFLIISSWLLKTNFFHGKEPGREENVLSHFHRANHVCTLTFRID